MASADYPSRMTSSPPSVLVLGAAGMLGHKLVQELGKTMNVTAALRAPTPAFDASGITSGENVVFVDALDAPALQAAIARSRPDVIVNAIGVIKQSPVATDAVQTIAINALFPHQLLALAERHGMRVIHLSTDCVFSGADGHYREDDVPDARDLYGRSKLLGELDRSPGLTLRTSMIGRELQGRRSLVEWFLQSRGRVKGYEQAYFSGLTTIRLARLIGTLIADFPSLGGMYQVAAAPISKLALLRLLQRAFDVPVEIEPSDEVRIDRSLDGSRFREATGFVAPDWPGMIDEMRLDPLPYDALHAAGKDASPANAHA